MSLLLVSALSLGSFCYDAEYDIGDNKFMEKAVYFEEKLKSAKKEKGSVCWPITSNKEYEEASLLISMDPTSRTLSIK